MKISVVACTWSRPRQLGQLIKCFQEQDLPLAQREMIILDDCGQYENISGEGWQLVSVPRRFKTLGEKRNATIGLVADDSQAVSIWDDDDLYLPWHLSNAVAALQQDRWSRPSAVLYEHPDHLKIHQTNGLYQGGWSFRLEQHDQSTGRGLPAGVSYGPTSIIEDQVLAKHMQARGVTWADPIALGRKPSYVYRDASSDSYHASYMGDCANAWKILGDRVWDGRPLTHDDLNKLSHDYDRSEWIALPRDYRSLPIRH